jgi:hypothetical protein
MSTGVAPVYPVPAPMADVIAKCCARHERRHEKDGKVLAAAQHEREREALRSHFVGMGLMEDHDRRDLMYALPG